MNPNLRSLFLLDPEVIFLNHGSFGACPGPVLDVYQGWQERLEKQPVRFLARELPELLEEARSILAEAVGCRANDLVYLPNATYGVNAAARSLKLGPGDEILTTNHEYGACLNAWKYLSRQTGAELIQQPLTLPVRSSADLVEAFWERVTPRTKVIFLSHITSPTALVLPVRELCARARDRGILTVVDGAHAPGQIPLDLPSLGADFYTGNCHKWLLAPKGAAFLYVRPDRHHLIEPLVVSWGWGENRTYRAGSRLVNLLEWQGTRDPSAALTVPAALVFQKKHGWEKIREHCRGLLMEYLPKFPALTGKPSLYGSESGLFRQMAAVELPPLADPADYQSHLYREHRIEIPVIEWHGRHLLRISVQGYNQASDLEALLEALNGSLASFTTGK
jgi:isopenicillin-N epimerase